MSSYTENLKLFKWNPKDEKDKKQLFDINKSINENWDKIDEEVAKKVTAIEGKNLSSNDYTDEEKDKVANLNNYDDTELQDRVLELEKENTDLRNNQLFGTAEGESINLTDSADAELESLMPKEKLEQETTEGKNLFDIQKWIDNFFHIVAGKLNSKSKDKISITSDTADCYTETYKMTNTDLETNKRFVNRFGCEINSDTAYTFVTKKNTTEKGNNFVFFYDENYKYLSLKNITLSNIYNILNFTTPANAKYVCFRLGIAGADKTIEFSNIMLLEGTYTQDNMPEYEPYTGGQPSPNPDYPQEIKTVTGDVEIKVQNKNLFDENTVILNKYLTQYNEIGDSKVTNISDYIDVSNFDKVILNFTNDNNSRSICLYDKNKKFIRGTDGVVPPRIINTSDAYYLRFSYYNKADDVQLELGTTATDYIEHQEQSYSLSLGNLELCKTDDAEDYFEKKSDDWYLHKEWEKVVFDKSLKYSFQNADSESTVFNVMNSYYQKLSSFYLSTSFIYNSSTLDRLVHNKAEKFIYISFNNETLKIKYSMTNDEKVDKLYEWLENNNITNYFRLETPEEIKITDETLISQLDALQKAKTYKNITNISSNVSENSVNPIIKIKYVKDLETVINNMQAMILAE